jgi:hypothetical protein|tara:strand:- start:123 stop:224 length:102 start_codon:yes stop_codon:yes gene_type:complete
VPFQFYKTAQRRAAYIGIRIVSQLGEYHTTGGT